MSKTLGNATQRATRGLRTAAAAGILGAALTAGFLVAGSNDSDTPAPVATPQEEDTADRVLTMKDRTQGLWREGIAPREDVLTASSLSDSWDRRGRTWQELACVEWQYRPDRMMAIMVTNAAALSQAFDSATAAEFFDYACSVSAAEGEIGTAVSLEPTSEISAASRPRTEVGDGGAERPARGDKR